MTVKELIDTLNEVENKDQEVCITVGEYEYCDINNINFKTYGVELSNH